MDQRVPPGSVFLSQETYRAVLTDMAISLKSMGFKNVILMGDSGGNQTGMKEVAAALNAKSQRQSGALPFHSRVLRLRLGAEAGAGRAGSPSRSRPGASSGSDGIHDEYGIDALMARRRSDDDSNRAA